MNRDEEPGRRISFPRYLRPGSLLSGSLSHSLGTPGGSLKRLVDALDHYHKLVIVPYRPRIREHLEADVLRRGQALVLGGAETFFSGLSSRVDYRGRVLKLDRPYEAAIEAAGRGMTLVPCAFSWPGVLTLVDPRFRPWPTLLGASRNCGPPRGRLLTGRRSRLR